jgi:hypothetical protein
MLHLVSRLGDRLLGAVVPEVTASAACEEYCWQETTPCAPGQRTHKFRTCCRFRSCVIYCYAWQSGQCPH